MVRESAHVILFKNNNNEVLLTERADMPLWVFPGGQKEANETIEQTAIREVKEETGLEVKIKTLVGIYESPDKKIKKYTYLGEVISGIPSISNETRKVEWVSTDKLPFNMLRFDYKRLQDALSKSLDIQKNYFINPKEELKYFSQKPLLLLHLLFRYILSNIT